MAPAGAGGTRPAGAGGPQRLPTVDTAPAASRAQLCPERRRPWPPPQTGVEVAGDRFWMSCAPPRLAVSRPAPLAGSGGGGTLSLFTPRPPSRADRDWAGVAGRAYEQSPRPRRRGSVTGACSVSATSCAGTITPSSRGWNRPFIRSYIRLMRFPGRKSCITWSVRAAACWGQKQPAVYVLSLHLPTGRSDALVPAPAAARAPPPLPRPSPARITYTEHTRLIEEKRRAQRSALSVKIPPSPSVIGKMACFAWL